MEFWSGIWSGMESDFEFCHPSRTEFFHRPTNSDGVEWGQILEGTSRLKVRQSQAIFYDLPKMSIFIQQVWV